MIRIKVPCYKASRLPLAQLLSTKSHVLTAPKVIMAHTLSTDRHVHDSFLKQPSVLLFYVMIHSGQSTINSGISHSIFLPEQTFPQDSKAHNQCTNLPIDQSTNLPIYHSTNLILLFHNSFSLSNSHLIIDSQHVFRSTHDTHRNPFQLQFIFLP